MLGGRAVQDIWIVPGRGEPGEGVPPLAFHGSTIRFYDAALGAWRSTWIDPVNGRVRRFIGREVEGEIVLLSDEDDPRARGRGHRRHTGLRWRSDTDIAPSDSWVTPVARASRGRICICIITILRRRSALGFAIGHRLVIFAGLVRAQWLGSCS